jgi:hypothetical protein
MNDLRGSVKRAGAALAVVLLAACGSADARQAAPDAEPVEPVAPAAEEPAMEPRGAEIPGLELDTPALERERPREPPVLRRRPDPDAFHERPRVRQDRAPQMREA